MTVLLPIRALDPVETADLQVEPDTLLLYDPAADVANGLAPGYGAALDGGTPPLIVAGTYREGVEPATATNSFLWLPEPLPLGADQFTIEALITAPVDWSATTTSIFLCGAGNNGNNVVIYAGSGKLNVQLSHLQNPASPASYAFTKASSALTLGAFPAAAQVRVMVTLKAGVLTAYMNGVQKISSSGFVPPALWSSNMDADGVMIGGEPGSTTSSGWIIEGLRTSRQARVPGVQILSSDRSTITVGAATGNQIYPMCGVLKALPTSSADSQQLALRGLKNARLTSQITFTPIKAGSPDSTHPTLGHSGSYSYDWSMIVDPSVNYIVNTLGCTPYVCMEGNHQLTGGGIAPATSPIISGKQKLGFDNTVPTDFNAYATFCADFIYHVTVELGASIVGASLWNEPDISDSWLGTQNQWMTLWTTVMAAVLAACPTVQVGGPEIGGWVQSKTWVQALVNAAAAATVPLHFVSYHGYDGSLSTPAEVAAQTASWCATAGIPTPWFAISEWAWSKGNLIVPPWWIPSSTGDSVQLIRITGNPTGGRYTLAWNGQATSLAPNASPNAIGIAFRALSNVGAGNAATSSSQPTDGTGMFIHFTGALGGVAQPLITIDTSGLTGGTNVAATVTEPPYTDYQFNDFMAAWHATLLIQQQKWNFRVDCLDAPREVAPNNGAGYFNPTTSVPTVNYNVARMFSRMAGDNELAVTGPGTVACDPSVSATASQGGGKIRVFIAACNYRTAHNDGSARELPVLVKLDPSLSIADGTPVSLTRVDADHANAYDAGDVNADLTFGNSETTTGPLGAGVVAGNQFGVLMPARGVALVEIG